MIKPDQIPKEVVEAASRSRAIRNEGDDRYWKDYAEGVEADILAGLNAWPGMGKFEDETGWDVHIELPLLIFLPQEAGDETVP